MAASAVLDITHGPSKGTRFAVTADRPVGVGRGSDNGPGKIKDSSISRVHGTFSVSPDRQLVFKDSSRNGTWFVRAGEREPSMTLRQGTDIDQWHMAVGDRIMLGHTTIAVASLAAGLEAPAAASSAHTGSSISPSAERATTAARPSPAARTSLLAAAGHVEGNSMPRSRRASDAEAEALFTHPFSRLLAAGPPASAGAPSAHPRPSAPALSGSDLASVGRSAIGHL